MTIHCREVASRILENTKNVSMASQFKSIPLLSFKLLFYSLVLKPVLSVYFSVADSFLKGQHKTGFFSENSECESDLKLFIREPLPLSLLIHKVTRTLEDRKMDLKIAKCCCCIDLRIGIMVNCSILLRLQCTRGWW